MTTLKMIDKEAVKKSVRSLSLSYRRKPVSRYFKELQRHWTPVFTPGSGSGAGLVTTKTVFFHSFRGFTLIEFIVTIIVLGILAAFGFSFFPFLTQTYVTMNSERGIQQEGAYVVERIARELRDASAVATGTGSATITLQHATPASGSTSAAYSLLSGMLRRNDGINNVLIGENVSSFSITAAATANCYNVSLATTRDGVTRPFATTVCPKNLAGDTSGYKGDYSDTY